MSPINNCRGSAAIFIIIFIAVFMLIFCICVELYHTVTLRNYIENELSRALKIAVGMSMQDEYRKDHISRIDAYTAKEEFEKYLQEAMMLDENNQRIVNQEVIYKLQVDYMDIVAEPPAISIKGSIEKSPLIFNFSKNITISYSIKVVNKRKVAENE